MQSAYAAGLLDGEGNILVDKCIVNRPSKPYRRYQLRVTIGMTHYPTIMAVYHRFGGSVTRNHSAHNKNPANRIQYHWYTWSDYALAFLLEVEPYLITKREEALLGIEFQRHLQACDPLFRKHRGNPPNYAEIYEYRESLLVKMKTLRKLQFDVSRVDLKNLLSVSDGPKVAVA